MMEDTLVVGEVLRPQGLRGEVKVKPLTDDPDRFFALRRVFLRGEEKRCRCLRVHEGYAYLQIDGIFSREAAEGIRGDALRIRREDAVKLPENAEFIGDLIGCQAVDTEGRIWGELKDVLQPGEPLRRVRPPPRGRPRADGARAEKSGAAAFARRSGISCSTRRACAKPA